MWMILLAGLASAESEPCPEYWADDAAILLPRDGDVFHTPADGVIAAALNVSGSDQCSAQPVPLSLTLAPEDQPDAATALTIPPRGAAPFGWAAHGLEPGTYLVRFERNDTEIREFLVVDDLPTDDPPSTHPPLTRVFVDGIELYSGTWTAVSPEFDQPATTDVLVEAELVRESEARIVGAGAARDIDGQAYIDTYAAALPADDVPELPCLRARYVSLADVPGPWSEPVCATPETTFTERTGCSTSGGSPIGWLALALLLPLVRRRRSCAPATSTSHPPDLPLP